MLNWFTPNFSWGYKRLFGKEEISITSTPVAQRKTTGKTVTKEANEQNLNDLEPFHNSQLKRRIKCFQLEVS